MNKKLHEFLQICKPNHPMVKPPKPSTTMVKPVLSASISYTKPKNILIPLLDNVKAIAFWLGFIVFFAIFGVGVQYKTLLAQGALLQTFFDILFTQSCIIFGILIAIHVTKDSFQSLSIRQGSKRIFLISLLLTTPMALLAKTILYILGFDFSLSRLIHDVILINVLVMIALVLMLSFFASQYQQISVIQKRLNQKLIEQNEQLKARITPHFFFNMLNTMQYLVETDPVEAEKMIRHVSSLYRASFGDIKEIAMQDEIEICQHYLDIERYRFAGKLTVNWDLPDEDILYDMVIASLTLQMVIEKMISFVVEMTNETIYLNIHIHWQNDMVDIHVRANLPKKNHEVLENIHKSLSFQAQAEVLQQFFTEEANIDYLLEKDAVVTKIHYPLKDVVF